MLRRQILATVASVSFSYLAGCNDLGENSGPEADGNSSELSDEGGTGARNGYAPTISFEALLTQYAGRLDVSVRAEDDKGLEEVVIALNGEDVEREALSGTDIREYEDTITAGETDAMRVGEINTVQAAVTDTGGNTAEDTADQYVREYDVLESPRLDVAVSYAPWFNREWRREECTDGQPSVGFYSMKEEEALMRQVDQMQGFGVSTLQFHFDRPDEYTKAFTRTLDTSPLDSIPLEIYYTRPFKSGESTTVIEQIHKSFDFAVEHYLTRDPYNTISGQPVISFWDIDWIPWAGTPAARESRDAILSEWGSYEGFVDFIREKHTIDEEPYLVAGTGNNALGGFPDEFAQLNKHFDALTTWISPLSKNETTPWDEAVSHIEDNYAATREFAESHDMDFIPMVFPGFDTRSNNCWGSDEHIPRSPDHFSEVLALADQYRTIDRINVATWNDWGEGHQIEPGTFQGNEYGTAYLSMVEEFQQQ